VTGWGKGQRWGRKGDHVLLLGKTVKAGPFRVSLNRSGIGVPTRVPGLRVGAGPRGTYIRVGTLGVCYQQTLSPPHCRGRATGRRLSQQEPRPRRLATDEVLMEDVTGMTTLGLAGAAPSELVSQVNDAARRVSLLPLVVLLWLPLITIPLAILVHARDKARRSMVAFYEVDGAPAARFQALVDRFHSGARRLRSTSSLHRIGRRGQDDLRSRAETDLGHLSGLVAASTR
jgi:uncharacterized protein DUF4236